MHKQRARNLFGIGILLAAIMVCVGFYVRHVLSISSKARVATLSQQSQQSDLTIGLCRDKNFIAFGYWPVRFEDGVSLHYVVSKYVDIGDQNRGGQKLSIFDESGKLLYEETAISFGKVYSLGALRNSTSQLILSSINYGGSARFFKVLDFREGRVKPITSEDDMQFTADAQISPQFRNGVRTDTEPYEIVLTDPGLASNTHYARVYRYKNGKYVYQAEYNRQTAGDAVERLSSRKVD